MSLHRILVPLFIVAAVMGLTALIGCETAHRTQSGAVYSPPANAPRAEVDSFFDPSMPFYRGGRLKDPLIFGAGQDELWIIAEPAPGGPPMRTTDGFTPFGLTQDSFDLVDLLGGLAADSFSGTIVIDDAYKTIDPTTLVDPCGGIVGIPIGVAEPTLVRVPLKHTEVRASVTGYIASVDVTQQFHNPYNGKIEAVYVFPLPQDAGVTEFVMTIGDRRIRGIIREKQEAERIYKEARSQGHVASLLTQQRPNIFTQKVANIEPGKKIDVSMRYFHTLTYDDGWYEFAFPMVVGPRFNPSGSGDPINAVRRTSRRSPSGTDVPYMRPNERSGHDIALAVDIDAGVNIEEIRCNSHAINSSFAGNPTARISLSNADTIPNRDFVLRWRVAGDRIKTTLLTQQDSSRFGGVGHFTMMIYPPAELSNIDRSPIEMVFVIDCSGSMKGEPLKIAKAAAERALRTLRPEDTFQIIRFSENASSLGSTTLAATSGNVKRGLRYLRGLDSGGGTQMVEGIKAALDFRGDSERPRYVVFLTDGYIGNEAEVLGVMSDRLRRNDTVRTRVFSFGIGSSVNRFLMERMASLGDGAVAYVGLNDSPTDAMDRFIDRVSHPALTGISLDFGGAQVADLYPSRVPDLFSGRPIVIAGRYRGAPPHDVRVTGRAGPLDITMGVDAGPNRGAQSKTGIASVWARTRITELTNRSMTENSFDFRNGIRHLALEYGLMSAYTAFVAVDSSQRTAGEYGTTVDVPVNVPDGVRYDTTVGN